MVRVYLRRCVLNHFAFIITFMACRMTKRLVEKNEHVRMRIMRPSVRILGPLRGATSRASGSRATGHVGLTTLVVADHDNVRIKPATRNAVTAAMRLGNDVHLLVAGANCTTAASEGSQISGVSRVLALDHASLANFIAENVTAAIQTSRVPLLTICWTISISNISTNA